MPWARILDISLGGDPNFPFPTPTPTVTSTSTPSITATPTQSSTQSTSQTSTITASPTPSRTPTITSTNTPSMTATSSQSSTQSISQTPTITASTTLGTPTVTRTPTASNIPAVSVTQTVTQSQSQTSSMTGSASQSLSNTETTTPTRSSSTPSITPTIPVQTINILGPLFTNTPTYSFIPSFTPSFVPSPTPSKSFQQISDLQTEIIPIDQEELTILDPRDNDIIVQITFDSPNANEYLLISEANNLPIVDRNRVQSIAVSLNLLNGNGIEIQPSDSVEICLKADSDSNESCLGFVNENASPPKWECEDKCLSKNKDGLLCGETDHFTNFAILFTGVKSNCDDDFNYIFDEAWKDGVLIGCVAAAIICFLIIGTIIIVASPLGSKIVRGKEGHRISKLRSLNDTQTEVLTNNVSSGRN